MDRLQTSSILRSLAALTLCLFLAPKALGGDRKALIIGNGDYQTIPALSDPLNDVDLMEALFNKKLGFRVYQYKNLTARGQKNAFELFMGQIRRDDEIVIYYAGHGVQVNHENYILPVDLNVSTTSELIEQSLSIEELLAHAQHAGASLSVVFLDACRTEADLLEDDTMGNTRSAFAQLNGTARKASRRIQDVLTCYATEQGTPAFEGKGSYSPYSQALAEELIKKQSLIDSLINVRNKVMEKSGGKQKPFFEGSLGEKIWWAGKPTMTMSSPPPVRFHHSTPSPPPLPAPIQQTKLIVNYTGSEGINIRDSRHISTKNLHGALFQQSEIPLIQIGEPLREGSKTWVKIEVKGWIPATSQTRTYMANTGHRQWKVTWKKPGDAYVSMRTGPSTDRKLVCKVAYATYLEELDSRHNGSMHYIYGRFTGWSVMRTSSSTYIRQIYQ